MAGTTSSHLQSQRIATTSSAVYFLPGIKGHPPQSSGSHTVNPTVAPWRSVDACIPKGRSTSPPKSYRYKKYWPYHARRREMAPRAVAVTDVVEHPLPS